MARRKRESTEILNRNEVSRREFLQIAGAAAGLTLLPRVAAANARVIRAEPALATLVGEACPQTAVWTYGGTVPGTELRFKQGERLRVELENLLPEDTAVHWHGVRLPNAMDGVPGLTQAPIAAKGGRFPYEFELRDAGTYWYHPHLGSSGRSSPCALRCTRAGLKAAGIAGVLISLAPCLVMCPIGLCAARASGKPK